jgi:hypothetical protein
MLSIIMLNAAFSYCYAKCHYVECHYAECLYAKCRGAIWVVVPYCKRDKGILNQLGVGSAHHL